MSARFRHVRETGTTVFEGIFNCPHCGHENAHWFPLWQARPEVVCCDNETGGCDTYFAVTAVVEVTVTPTARKIEGIGPSRETIEAWGRAKS